MGGGPVVIGGDNLPSPVRIGLTDLQNIGGASGPPCPPGSCTSEEIAIMHRLFDLFLVICSLASSHLHFHSGYVPAVYMY